jgi:hypothetical protein
MPNKSFQDLLKADIAALIAESFAIDKINHEGLKGNIREYGFGRLLSKYLTHDWAIGKGQIHDHLGNESAETDLLIFNKSILAPIMFGELLGLYPLDSCAYSIEVKTRSTAKEIQTTIKKFNTLKKLTPINNTHQIHRVYIALSSDLKKVSELERYKKYDKNFYTDPAANIIVVLGQGYWYYNRGNKEGKNFGYWQFIEPLKDFYELGMLLGGIMNTLNANSPPFGYYVLVDGTTKIVDEGEI